MIDDFYGQAWAEAHEKFAAEVSAGFARLARWLRRRAEPKTETPAATTDPGKGRRPRRGTPLADARRISAKTAAPHVSGAFRPRRD